MTSEISIRLGFLFGVVLLLFIAEQLSPRRKTKRSKTSRWFNNFGLVVLNSIVLKLVAPIGATGVALYANSQEWGLFNIVSMNGWLELIATLVILDFAIYWQHVVFHKIPWLWQLHLVHHADVELDASTGVRFHLLEILLSFAIKCAVIATLGASATAVLIFEIVLNATAMFNHSNFKLPSWLDRLLKFFIVTPDMHVVHHSVEHDEMNTNFGFNLPWWDYLFRTYRGEPKLGHEHIEIGTNQFRGHKSERLHWMLLLPFVRSSKRRENQNQE